MYSKAIDSLKGVLILLVILGHLLLGSLNENFGRYFIYSFHMPLFIAVSGYLINLDKLSAGSYKSLLDKYLMRLIVPWAIAIVLYFVLIRRGGGPMGLIDAFIRPYYHLWYIPSFLVFVCLLKLMLQFIKKPFILLVAAAIIGVCAKFIADEVETPLVEDFTHTIRLQFFPFLVLGAYLKKHLPHKITALQISLLLVATGATIGLFWVAQPTLSLADFFVFNGILIVVVMGLVYRNKFPVSNFTVWAGKNSLALYLYHVVPIYVAHKLYADGLNYYAAGVIFLAIFLVGVWLFTRVEAVNKLLFGVR